MRGRPVAWVFTGAPPEPDGSQVFVDDALAVTSTNHAQLVAGAAYPLFYDTLFASLRQVLADAAVTAQQRKDGLWASDRTLTGVDGSTVAALEEGGVVIPKLFRRLAEFHGNPGRDLAAFKPWLATEKPEQIVDLDDNTNFTHLDNLVEVTGNRVRLTRPAHRLVIIGEGAPGSLTTPPSSSPPAHGRSARRVHRSAGAAATHRTCGEPH